jgi:hypothetical protein
VSTLIHLAGDEPRPEQAYALLANRVRVVVREMASAVPTDDVARDGRYVLWGGTAALEIALARPDRLDALVLEAPAPPSDDDQRLASLTVPTLVVYGTNDAVTSPEAGNVFRARLPDCQYVLVYAAGHTVAIDRPEAFASLVGDFLERRAAFIVSRTSSLLHP